MPFLCFLPKSSTATSDREEREDSTAPPARRGLAPFNNMMMMKKKKKKKKKPPHPLPDNPYAERGVGKFSQLCSTLELSAKGNLDVVLSAQTCKPASSVKLTQNIKQEKGWMPFIIPSQKNPQPPTHAATQQLEDDIISSNITVSILSLLHEESQASTPRSSAASPSKTPLARSADGHKYKHADDSKLNLMRCSEERNKKKMEENSPEVNQASLNQSSCMARPSLQQQHKFVHQTISISASTFAACGLLILGLGGLFGGKAVATVLVVCWWYSVPYLRWIIAA